MSTVAEMRAEIAEARELEAELDKMAVSNLSRAIDELTDLRDKVKAGSGRHCSVANASRLLVTVSELLSDASEEYWKASELAATICCELHADEVAA